MTRDKLLQNAKPILFSTDMVKAILDGRKTQTRRVIKERVSDNAEWGYTAFTPPRCISCRDVFELNGEKRYGEKFFKLPYQSGDILYVRETIAVNSEGEWYYVNGTPDYKGWGYKGIPSIHMPKNAARIFLRVTDVRVERLQEITLEDCFAEGVEVDTLSLVGFYSAKEIAKYRSEHSMDGYAWLWNGIYAQKGYGWDKNPWVWVYSFEQIIPETEDKG